MYIYDIYLHIYHIYKYMNIYTHIYIYTYVYIYMYSGGQKWNGDSGAYRYYIYSVCYSVCVAVCVAERPWNPHVASRPLNLP